MYAADAIHPNKTLEEKLQLIYTFRAGDKRLNLTIRQPYLDLLADLGNPHLHLPPVIHAAGTNGKGSTLATIRAILEAAGKTVHVYTSPHLHAFNERIRIAGTLIDDDDLEKRMDQIIALAAERELTFFEVTTAMALKAFADHPADFTLLETGLGGRLDCTNIVPHPALTLISHIGMDHMEFLGDQLADIAAEKAGIMKENAPCLIAKQDDDALYAQFATLAAAKNAPLYRYDRDWHTAAESRTNSKNSGHSTLTFDDMRGDTQTRHVFPRPVLAGPHQIDNAGTAIMACKLLCPDDITDAQISDGLRAVSWPARLEPITQGRIHDHMATGCTLWYDGGHNEDAGAALARQAALWQAEDDAPLYLVLGMMAHKDAPAYVRHLAPYATRIHTIPIADAAESACTPDALKQKIGHLHPHIDAYSTLESAIDAIPPRSRILLSGSLYLASNLS